MAKWEILNIDPWLKDYENDINLRMESYERQKEKLLGDGKRLTEFANAHNYTAFTRQKLAGYIGNGLLMQMVSTL